MQYCEYQSGDSVTLTMTASQGASIKDGQVVLRATGGSAGAPQVRTASVLVQATSE
jgi:hypothetical protein